MNDWNLIGPWRDAMSISAMAQRGSQMATASADTLLMDPQQYGVPPDVPRDRVYRFSRVMAHPVGCGGGSVVLGAVLALTDELGFWTVLEATPYDGKSHEKLYAFYEKHGFKHHPSERGLMVRAPKRSDSDRFVRQGVSVPAAKRS